LSNGRRSENAEAATAPRPRAKLAACAPLLLGVASKEQVLNVNLMRKVDFWVGVPLCFLATIWDRLTSVFRRRRAEGLPRRILFIELAEIGGLVVAYPSLSHAQRRFPQAELYFLTFSTGEGILGLMNIIPPERQILIRPHRVGSFVADTLRAIRRMRRERIDAVINLETFARFSTLLAYFSGARRRVGFHRFHDEGRYTGSLVTHRVVYNPHRHAAETFITLVEALTERPDHEPRAKAPLDGIPLDVPHVHSTETARRAVLGQVRELYPELAPQHRLVLLNANASDLVAVRRWPTDNFLAVARELLKDSRVLILLTGTSCERDHAERVRTELRSDRVLNLAGRTTLPQLVDLYNTAHLLITNDSGPAHFASLTALPVLVLFGPETPRIYGPLGSNVSVLYRALACSPCVSAYNQKRSPCTDNRCLKEITPLEVSSRAKELLHKQNDPLF